MTQPALYTIPISKPWLPAALKARLAAMTTPLRATITFSAAERTILRRRRPVLVSVWCERHRVVAMSALAGPWKNATTPYLVGVMDASFFPSVQDISLCKVPQSGGTEAVNNCIAYAADRAPGPALFVYSDEQTAKENCQDRITPIFTGSAHLRSLLTGRDDDTNMLRIKLIVMPIYMAWARSVARLANKPCRYVVFDETDKYPAAHLAETDPLRLGELRTVTYRWNRKIWKISSPTVESGYIWQSVLASQVIFEYVVVCPNCGHEQVMRFGDRDTHGGVKWPVADRDPDNIQDKDLAWYECEQENCLGHWKDFQRDQAVRDGYWRAKNDGREIEAYLNAMRPRRIAFHIPAWLSTFVGLSKIAAEFLRCKPDGKNLDLNAHKNFCNAILAEPWYHREQERKEDAILALADTRPDMVVPGGGVVSCLLAVADTQDNGFWFEVRAFGFGQTLPSWGVHAGFVDDLAALAQVFAASYHDAQGNEYRVHGAGIDAMGHRTIEVYDWCRSVPGVFPLRGEHRMSQPFAWTQIEYYPGTKRPIPGGIKLLRVHSKIYKDALAGRLKVAPADPGAWLMAEGGGYNEEWARQLCAEFINDKGDWECPSGRPNHAWDVSYNLLALVDLYRVKLWPSPAVVRRQAARPAGTTNPYTGGRALFGPNGGSR